MSEPISSGWAANFKCRRSMVAARTPVVCRHDQKWDITEALGYIRVPILVVQGEDDQYGTLKQVEAAQQECFCPVETAVLPNVRHAPFREAPELTLKIVVDFINRLFRDHHEGEKRADSGVDAI